MDAICSDTMPMKWRLPVLMADREVDYKKLAEMTGMHPGTVSKLKNNLPDRVDMVTLMKLCRALECQPGDLLVYIPGKGDEL